MSSIFTSSRLSDDLGDLKSRLNDQYSRLDREYRFYENRYQDIRRRLFDHSPLKPSWWTSITNDSDRFCLRLDVGHFDPDDIEVTTRFSDEVGYAAKPADFVLSNQGMQSLPSRAVVKIHC